HALGEQRLLQLGRAALGCLCARSVACRPSPESLYIGARELVGVVLVVGRIRFRFRGNSLVLVAGVLVRGRRLVGHVLVVVVLFCASRCVHGRSTATLVRFIVCCVRYSGLELIALSSMAASSSRFTVGDQRTAVTTTRRSSSIAACCRPRSVRIAIRSHAPARSP